MIGAKSRNEYLRCPHCSGVLSKNNDGYENYLTCLGCAREYDYNLKPIQMTPVELEVCYGIKLIVYRKPTKGGLVVA